MPVSMESRLKSEFSVHLTRTAENDVDDLRPYRDRVIQELIALERDPYKGHPLRGKLQGLRSLEFSLPGGVCRAVYAVKTSERVCLLIVIGYHHEIYERAERRVGALRARKVI